MNRRKLIVIFVVLIGLLGGSSVFRPTGVLASPGKRPVLDQKPKPDRIFYISSRNQDFGDFFIIYSDGTGRNRLTTNLFIDTANKLIKDQKINYRPYKMTKGYLWNGGAVSPDGRYLALCWTVFIVDSSLGGDNLVATKPMLYVIDGMNYDVHTIPVQDIKRFSLIDWSPLGHKLAFVAQRDGKGQIDIVDVDNDFKVNPFIQDDIDKDDPSWSPNGEWIAYVGSKDGKSELHRADADGTNSIILTSDLHIDLIPNIKTKLTRYRTFLPEEKWQPDWSPNSEHILFVSWQGAEGALYVVDSDGSQAHELVASPNGGGAGWFDNQTILFGSDRRYRKQFQMFQIKVDGSGEKRLTNMRGGLTMMDWSPDHTRVLFNTESHRVYDMNADGSNQRLITFSAFGAAYWEPWNK